MLAGLLAALGAGLVWGLVFVVPLMLAEYPGVVLAFGRYVAFGVLAVGLAAFDRAALARLTRDDWIEAAKLALVGNLVYYSALASAIQLDRRRGAADALPWRRLAAPLAVIVAGLVVVQFGPSGATAERARPDGPRHAFGLLLALCAVACWTWYPIRNSRWLRARGEGLSRAWATAQGLTTLPLALAAALAYAAWETAAGGTFDWPFGPRPLAYVGLMASVGLAASWLGTLLWNRASRALPPALVGQLIVFETLAALLYAFLWYRRWPTLPEAFGIALLVAGVLLGVRVFRSR